MSDLILKVHSLFKLNESMRKSNSDARLDICILSKIIILKQLQ